MVKEISASKKQPDGKVSSSPERNAQFPWALELWLHTVNMYFLDYHQQFVPADEEDAVVP